MTKRIGACIWEGVSETRGQRIYAHRLGASPPRTRRGGRRGGEGRAGRGGSRAGRGCGVKDVGGEWQDEVVRAGSGRVRGRRRGVEGEEGGEGGVHRDGGWTGRGRVEDGVGGTTSEEGRGRGEEGHGEIWFILFYLSCDRG